MAPYEANKVYGKKKAAVEDRGHMGNFLCKSRLHFSQPGRGGRL